MDKKMRLKSSVFIALICFVLIFFVTLQIAAAISVLPVCPSGKKVTGDQWLFVIGINTYIEWPRLETATNDARAVKEVLLSRYHFGEEHTIELYDENATRANIISKLRFLAKTLKEDDSLFIFYAGHGYLDPITKSGSWIPVESGTKDASAWISNNYIKNYLKSDAIRAKHILLVSDSCFSGDFFRGHRGKLPEVTSEMIRRSYELSSRQAITSGGLEPVTDSGFGGNSVFTHFFIRALKNNQSPFLVPSEFFTQIKAGVSENAEQFPQFGSLKNTGGQQGGEFVFFLRQDAKLQNLSDIEAQKRKEYERLLQMEQEANLAQKREAEEIALKEKEMADLDREIEAMKNRLGTSEVRTDDSLDAMLAMVEQKEQQEKKLEQLRKHREEEQRKREAEIARLKKAREEKIIAALKPEVEKYKKIVASKYGESLKSSAWNALIAKCPIGWADDIKEGSFESILFSPEERKNIQNKKYQSANQKQRIEVKNEELKYINRLIEKILGYAEKTALASALVLPDLFVFYPYEDRFLKKSSSSDTIICEKSIGDLLVKRGWYIRPLNSDRDKLLMLKRGIADAFATKNINEIMELKNNFQKGIAFSLKESDIRNNPKIALINESTSKNLLNNIERTNRETQVEPKVIGKDEHFIKYDNEVVYDTKTGLEWIPGPDADWKEANSWAANLNLDGGGWRVPLIEELRSIHKKGIGPKNRTILLKSPGISLWSCEKKNEDAGWTYNFLKGKKTYYQICYGCKRRVFAVRNKK